MISLFLLTVITIILLVVAFVLLTLGGSLFILIFGDIIVALGIIWFIFLRKKGKSK